MLSLYVGLVFAYGIYGFLHNRATHDDVLQRTLMGLVWASTILHYYYDGFIWKVREKSTRVGLGLKCRRRPDAGPASRPRRMDPSSQMRSASFRGRLAVVWRTLRVSLCAAGRRSPREHARRSVRTRAEHCRGGSRQSGHPARAAASLAKYGWQQEAFDLLQHVVERHPSFADGYLMLGNLYLGAESWTKRPPVLRQLAQTQKRRMSVSWPITRRAKSTLSKSNLSWRKADFVQLCRKIPDTSHRSRLSGA